MHTGRYAAHVSDSRESRNGLMRIPIEFQREARILRRPAARLMRVGVTDMREMCCCGPGARTPLLIVLSLVAIRPTWAFIPTTVQAPLTSRAVAGLLHVDSSVDNLLFDIDHGEAEDGTSCCIIADGSVLGARRGDITAYSGVRARSRTLRDNSIINVLSDSGVTLNCAPLCYSDMLVTLGCRGCAALNDVGSGIGLYGSMLGSAPEGFGASALGSVLNGISSPALGSSLDCSTLGPSLTGLGSSMLGSEPTVSRRGSALDSSKLSLALNGLRGSTLGSGLDDFGSSMARGPVQRPIARYSARRSMASAA